MRLADLLDGIETENVIGNIDIEVAGIAYDSRQLAPGGLFVCLKGLNTDGHLYLPEAISRGAAGVVIEEEVKTPEGLASVRVENSRKALAGLSNRFFGDPTSKLTLVGVTGTNGKTTTTYLIESIARAAGKKTGLVGTVKYQIGDRALPVARTTPESSDLQRIFNQMVEEGVELAVIEVSSHAIHQRRIDGCRFDALVFTNLSQDHLDYHGDIEAYFQVKASLFDQAHEQTYRIINIDDFYGWEILKKLKGIKTLTLPILTYGLTHDHSWFKTRDKNPRVDGTITNIDERGSEFNIHSPTADFSVRSQLVGNFNVYNSLAAAAVGIALGFPVTAIKEGLESVANIPGRFETVDLGQDFLVVVDYAHTPDGLANVLGSAEQFSGRIITVFGCGGDRDKSKRPLMGQIAARTSQYVVVTNDNPRSEKPDDIIEQIEGGFKKVRKPAPYVILPDRREAIFHAIAIAEKGNLVLIAGKGHETGQAFADKTVPFDDKEVAAEAIRERLS